ncbi:MAG: metalloregulator ArsR/SmtB family transcription factor [Candidatus Pristimantibacillus lignocellulolyticus]|uniref:Metalloregulator ArsR/SmtB family transcription factor n=1 Tax=Candidatus Pristimantibacillus lignocellulolyticus TaxID=2994561 RepID=A0A9J6Z8X5_9BACL|nr:MAG: metalloregulator ArsR/SmtB family transcription factor [Candidatus Pristimantibacillus lignocellulolyticus]
MVRIVEENCDDTCLGTETNLNHLSDNKLDEKTALDLADTFKALGDPTRVKLIHALLNNELCVHDLCVVLGMTQSAVSHQLRYLRDVRMVKRRKEGKTVYYSIDDDHVKEIYIQTLNHLQHTSTHD